MIYNQFFTLELTGININGNQNFVHCEAVMYKSIHPIFILYNVQVWLRGLLYCQKAFPKIFYK